MSDENNLWDILVLPIKDIIVEIATSVAEAQRELDNAALNTQRDLADKYPELAKIGYTPTWYHMPEINVELKMVMHYNQAEDQQEGVGQGEDDGQGEDASKKGQVMWAAFNADYSSSYAYGAEGTSNLKFKIVSTPPPVGFNSRRNE
jgi:hypothetical protein